MTNQKTHGVTFSNLPWQVVTIVLLGACSLAFLGAGVDGSGASALIGIGLLSLLAVTFPFLVKHRFDPFEPMILLAFSVLMGCTLRAIMLATADPSDYKVFFLTDGMSNSQIASNAVLAPIALAVLSLGYIAASGKRFPIERIPAFTAHEWRRRRLNIAVVTLIIVSALAMFQLSTATGVDLANPATLSIKRAVQLDDGGYARLGYLSWVADLAKLGLFLALAERLSRNEARRSFPVVGRLFNGSKLLFLLLLSLFWPIVSSSRTGVLQVAFGLAILATYLGGKGGEKARRNRFMLLAAVGMTFAVLTLVAIGLWRQYSQLTEVLDTSVSSAIVNNTVGSGNFFPLERTAVIIDRVPERGGWQFGKSYINIIFAPIPRVLWPDKPETGLGLHVKSVIYQRATGTNGYPPGLVGEAYINFGVVGSMVITFLAGVFLKIFYNSFRPLLVSGNRNAVLIYALVLWPIGFQIAELDFAHMLINTLTAAIPAILVILFISGKYSRRASMRTFGAGARLTGY